MTNNRFKYPRTFHLPYSLQKANDDKVLATDTIFTGKQVIVTEKMDGENTTIYPDYLHARSINSDWDESRRWLDRLRLYIAADLPEGWRICGENMFYKHTIHYTQLHTLFYVYSIWNGDNTCVSWQETIEWCKLLHLQPMPVIYQGVYARQSILDAFVVYTRQTSHPVEGFVVRLAESFTFENFKESVAKFVNAGFRITTTKHWKHDIKEMNQLQNNRNVWEIIS